MWLLNIGLWGGGPLGQAGAIGSELEYSSWAGEQGGPIIPPIPCGYIMLPLMFSFLFGVVQFESSPDAKKIYTIISYSLQMS